jgi:hypothetical protein
MAPLVGTSLIVLFAWYSTACGSGTSNSSQTNQPPSPTIASFTPSSGAIGTSVVITGMNLAGATAVAFNGTAAASFSVSSANQVNATVAAGTSSGPIKITTPGGTATSAETFTVVQAPTITGFSPASGAVGTSVIITGTNLTGATSVAFNGKAASSFTVNSSTQVTAVVAGGTSTGPIQVTTAGGSASSAAPFTVLTPPTISGFTPASGPVGASVVITGTNFAGATSVAFNARTAASFTVNSGTQITATVASGTTSGKISVTTPGGTATSANAFTVVLPPTISGFLPTSGPVGTAVVISGTNLAGATGVAFNGKAASFVVNGAAQITATVASGTTSGKVTVTTPGGTANSAGAFTITTSSGTLDLTIDGLYVIQATQDYPTPSIPLVQNRSAWVRVFVQANQTNTVAPQVRVNFVNGSTTNTLTINAPSASVPTSIDTASASLSWNAPVPAAWIQPGTQVTATVDPANNIPESNESNNDFSASLDVRALKPWKVTLIPIHTADGNQGVVENATRTRNDWIELARRLHPVADAVDVTVGSVMNSSVTSLQSSGTGWSTVLSELNAKRTADGVTDRYYFGAVHTTYSSGVAGLGYVGWPVAIGWDASGSFPAVLAHEEGHNFDRQHSPCGGASNPDPNYPYPGGVIGVPGWDSFASIATLKPATDTDIMGYCSNQWISDYTYLGELNFRQSSAIGAAPGSTGPSVSGSGLLVWGRIEDGQLTLEPAFRISSTNANTPPGPYTWEARDALGRVLASVRFEPREVADLPDRHVQLFSFVVPLTPEVLQQMQSMHVKSGSQELAARSFAASGSSAAETSVRVGEIPNRGLQIVWDSGQYSVLMLRDAQTGEVRGFARGGSMRMEEAPNQLDIVLPDAIHRRAIRYRRIGD